MLRISTATDDGVSAMAQLQPTDSEWARLMERTLVWLADEQFNTPHDDSTRPALTVVHSDSRAHGCSATLTVLCHTLLVSAIVATALLFLWSLYAGPAWSPQTRPQIPSPLSATMPENEHAPRGGPSLAEGGGDIRTRVHIIDDYWPGSVSLSQAQREELRALLPELQAWLISDSQVYVSVEGSHR